MNCSRVICGVSVLGHLVLMGTHWLSQVVITSVCWTQTQEIREIFSQGHTFTIYALAFSPTGETLASGGRDTTVRLWDVRTGELLRTLIGHTDRVMSVVYSPDGKMLASAGSFEDNTVCLWDVQTGQLLKTITAHPDRIFRVAYSPDSLTLVSGGRDTKIRFWDVRYR